MSLPGFSLNRPVTVSMLFAGILLLGIISLYNLSIELMPDISLGRITITTYVRGGMPSSDVEERITKVLEDALSDISHLKTILTISKEAESTVVLEFYPETNMNYASLDVRERLAKIKDKLPREAERPIVAQYTYGELPIISVTFLSKKFASEDVRKIAEVTKERFLRIEGVARVEVVGGREEKILIELDENKLASYRIPLEWVLETLGKNNINLLGGKITIKDKNYLIRCVGEFSRLEDIKNLGIAVSKEGSIIRLKDIAIVKKGYLEPRELSRFNIEPAVTLYIFKKSLSNTLKVCDEVEKIAKKLDEELGKYIDVAVSFNQAEFIKKAIKQLKISLLIGSILAISVLLFFLIKNISLIATISLSLPFSIFFAFILMYFSKISLNSMTLAGLCLGAGMLLDSSIVVSENIIRRKETKGIIRKEEPIKATEEVSSPILASLITTIIVFLPFIFINKETQKLYSGIALSIIFSLVGSVFIALSLVPLLSYLFLKKKSGREAQSLQKEVNKIPFLDKMKKIYKSSLELVIPFRYLVIILVFGGILYSLFLFHKLDKEFIGIPTQDKFTIFIELPSGTRLDVTDKIVKKVEKLVEKYRSEGAVEQYITRIEPFSAKIYVELAPLEKRKLTTTQLISLLRKETNKLSPAFIYYEEPETVSSKEIIVELFGYDYDILKNLAKQVGGQMRSIPGLTDIKLRMKEGAPEVKIILDKERMRFLGLNTQSVATKLHGKLRGLIPTRFRPTEEAYLTTEKEEVKGELSSIKSLYARYAKEIEMITRLQEKYRKKFEDIERTVILTPEREKIYLYQIAKFKIDVAPSQIWRKNKKRMVQISANRGNLPLGRIAKEVDKIMKNIKFPPNYTWDLGGDYQKMVRNQKELRWALLLAIALVYLVLAAFFENLRQPFIILSSVPLAFIGSLTALYIKKEPIGVGVLVGLILLVGIVVNNAIILVDAINRLRKKLSLKESVTNACLLRLRPIMMTTLTTVLSFLPLLIFKTQASNLWAPLALTIIWGLSISCLFTLYVIPCLYMVYSGRSPKRR